MLNGTEAQLALVVARWVSATRRVPDAVLNQAGAAVLEIHFRVEPVPAGGEALALLREWLTFRRSR